MNADDLRALMTALRARVRLADEGSREVLFDVPSAEELVAEGLHPEGVAQVLSAPWWPELVDDVVETPAFCDPGEPPARVLDYARDVVEEYLRKRFQL